MNALNRQQCAIAELSHMVDVLKGALAAAHVETVPAPAPWMQELTPACRALVGALHTAYPNILTHDHLMQILPSRGDPYDRQQRSINTLVKRTRKVLGRDSIVSEYGIGYHLSAGGFRNIPSEGIV